MINQNNLGHLCKKTIEICNFVLEKTISKRTRLIFVVFVLFLSGFSNLIFDTIKRNNLSKLSISN